MDEKSENRISQPSWLFNYDSGVGVIQESGIDDCIPKLLPVGNLHTD